MRVQQRREARTGAVVVLTAVLAPATARAAPAPAAVGSASLAGTVSCATSQGSLQIAAFAHRPSLGYAGAFVFTGFPNTPATIHLLGVETDTSKVTVDARCGPVKKSVRFTHEGLTSAGVVKAGYEQSLTAYCGAPSHVFVRYRIRLGSSGKPATATVTVWAKRKKSSELHEIGYVQWSNRKSVTYYAKQSCVGQS